jgi:sirohydrochlorin ferrochelatase
MSSNKKIAVIIVDHGSVRAEANEMLEQVADNLRAVRPETPVYVAHMELAEPSIEAAFCAAVNDGATHLVVHPYFLSPGRHSQQDIPTMAADAAGKFPGVRHVVTEPLGLDPLMTELVWKRIDQSRQTTGR